MVIQDLSSLDWARWYSDRTMWPIDRDLFLADAVLRIAPMMVFPWDDDFFTSVLAPVTPLIPDATTAFTPDSEPLPEVHETWGPALLRYMPIAEYEATRAVTADPAFWASRYEPNPAGGPPRARVGMTDATTISYDHWEAAALTAADVADRRDSARVAIRHIAHQIAKMALDEAITVLARPIGGGEVVAVDSDAWRIDDPAARIASCMINMREPCATSAPPTHLLFVSRVGFEPAAWAKAQLAPLSLLKEGITPKDAGVLGPRPSTIWKAKEDQAVVAMRAHLNAHPHAYTRPELRRVVGDVSDTVFEKARNRIREEFEFIKLGGAPRGSDRRPPAGR